MKKQTVIIKINMGVVIPVIIAADDYQQTSCTCFGWSERADDVDTPAEYTKLSTSVSEEKLCLSALAAAVIISLQA